MRQAPQTITPATLPRGRHAAPREVVWETHRERLLEAMANVTAEKGYGRTSVADVIASARVSRRTFYEHFDNKEECFLAAYDAGVELILAAIDDAVRAAAPDWKRGLREATRAYLETLAANPRFARTFLVEVLAAGTEAIARRSKVHELFARQLEALHVAAREDLRDLPVVPPYFFRASVGAVNELVVDHIERFGVESLAGLEDQILDIQTILLVGDTAGSSFSKEGP